MTDQFKNYAALGYTRLLPIIPPTAPISEGSSLFKRVGTHQDGRGKTPGVKGRDGNWFSFDWVPHEADAQDSQRWHGMGAGLGVKTGQGLIAIDADTMDTGHAKTILELVKSTFGATPIRVGQHPKALYLLRVDGHFQYSRVEFGPPNKNGTGRSWRVEILSDGRQFVAEGVHPKTKQPYEWPKPIVPFGDLPIATPQAVTAFLETLRTLLPDTGPLIKEGGTSEVNQAALTGTLEAVTRAVKAIPNTSQHFPSRESYRDFGYAIKAALPNNEPEALALFEDWCARWTDGDNAPDIVKADWSRMKPPFRVGAPWLYEKAASLNPIDFRLVDVWFDDISEIPVNPFSLLAETEAQTQAPDKALYPILSISDISNRAPAELLIARHIPKKSVGFLYSPPGAGKSFIALDQALHVAASLPAWNGDALALPEKPVVFYLAPEGSYGFKNRTGAWVQVNGHADALANSFFMIEQTVNFMHAEDIAKLLRTVRAASAALSRAPALIVVDTVSRSMPGADENLQKDMTLFVRSCDALRDAFDCAILGVHHAGKSGDMRGSTVLLGAGDFVFRLDRKKGATIGHLHCEKQKDGPDGWAEPYRFDLVHLDAGETSLSVARADMSIGPATALTPDVTTLVMAAIRAAWNAGEPWGKAAQTGERCAVRRMVIDFGFDAAAASETLAMWTASGLIGIAVVSKRDKLKGYKVLAEAGQPVLNGGIFD